MTFEPAPEASLSRLIVVGVDPEGAEVVRVKLGHGDDPAALLAVHSWEVRRVRDVVIHPVDRDLLTMTFVVEPSLADSAQIPPLARRVRQLNLGLADDLVIGPGEVALPRQRVAAYAVVTSSRGVLLTQFSDRTGAPGQWGLPGGGLEALEPPETAVVREVWEESGQVIEGIELALIQTRHWVGRAPTGQLEDFHAVRIIYRAACPEPTDPVVHDVGGTTASAAWLPPADIDLSALASGWRSTLGDVARLGGPAADISDVVVLAPDETDGPDQQHHHAESDDRAGPQS